MPGTHATTVGYGDFRPARKQSKFLAIVPAFVGLIFTGMVVAVALHATDTAFEKVYETSGFTDRPQLWSREPVSLHPREWAMAKVQDTLVGKSIESTGVHHSDHG